ncbi:MAG: thiamine-phosphate kinase [Coraliomargarita sp.]
MIFSEQPKAQVSSLGETKLIEHIREWLGDASPHYPHGMGDDCAVLPLTSAQQIITTDSLTYGQHVDSKVSAKNAGAKLIKRNLSDIAAMGGTPKHAVLALLCGPDVSIDWLQEFFIGVRETCLKYSLQLVGGDISSLPKGNFSSVLTLVGQTENPKLRKSAKVGDLLYVTGTLGGSILQKHYAFTPRLAEGQWIATHPACTALMDLTDGLGKDLNALLPQDSSALIELAQLPISEDAYTLSKQSGHPPERHAFCDGEDYELLLSVDAYSAADFESAWQQQFPKLELTRIGTINEAQRKGRMIDAQSNTALEWQHGFEHLSE